MSWRTIGGLLLLGAGLAGLGLAAAPSPLADAAERHDRTRVEELLRAGSPVNAAQVDGTTALHWAAYNDDAETAAALVKAGADVNALNRYGMPPFASACANGGAAVGKLLRSMAGPGSCVAQERIYASAGPRG